MNEYFTPEYVELCKNSRVQELRPEFGLYFFYLFEDKIKVTINHYRDFEQRSDVIWLPLSDQLDEEIVKICNEKNWVYFTYHSKWWTCKVLTECEQTIRMSNNTNPLIAKISLLIQLLKNND